MVSLHRFCSYWDHEEGYESLRFLTVDGHVPGSDGPVCSVDMLPAEAEFIRMRSSGGR
jgi:hypothetical protein